MLHSGAPPGLVRASGPRQPGEPAWEHICTVVIGPYPSPITVQWVESARAVAVYAPLPAPVPPCTPEALALNLARSQTLGASTLL